MHYMPANDNGAYFPPTSDAGIRILPFSFHVLKECMDPKVKDEVLERYFPGRTFYGSFLDPVSASEMRQSLGVLSAVVSVHGLFHSGTSLLEVSDEIAMEMAHKAIDILNETEGVRVILGDGYSDELNPEDSVPQCHILRCELSMPRNYFRWIEGRVYAFESLMQFFHAQPILFLNVSNKMALKETACGGILTIDIYGVQSLNEDKCCWLDEHEAALPWPGPAGIEADAGLLCLADVLATLHLMTAIPIVGYGALCRPTAGDSLTDFWLKIYDITDDMDYAVGTCEICGRMFIGNSKNKRGHKGCLNRRRVKTSRAKKFARLVESGVTEQEASKQASISAESAKSILASMKEIFPET